MTRRLQALEMRPRLSSAIRHFPQKGFANRSERPQQIDPRRTYSVRAVVKGSRSLTFPRRRSFEHGLSRRLRCRSAHKFPTRYRAKGREDEAQESRAWSWFSLRSPWTSRSPPAQLFANSAMRYAADLMPLWKSASENFSFGPCRLSSF